MNTGATVYDLNRHYLFSGLSDKQRSELLEHVHQREFGAEQLLFSQEDPADAFFLLQRGEIKLYRMSEEGQEKIMRLIRPGMSFAESVMFMDKPRYPVNAQGIESGLLLVIDSQAYLKILRASFPACRAVMATMAERIRAHWDEIEALTLQNSRYRIVHYLLGLVPEGVSGAVDITLPSRKAVIASQLGMTPETFSRTMHSLTRSGLVKVRDYVIHIPDAALLAGRLQ